MSCTRAACRTVATNDSGRPILSAMEPATAAVRREWPALWAAFMSAKSAKASATSSILSSPMNLAGEPGSRARTASQRSGAPTQLSPESVLSGCSQERLPHPRVQHPAPLLPHCLLRRSAAPGFIQRDQYHTKVRYPRYQRDVVATKTVGPLPVPTLQPMTETSLHLARHA